MITNMDEFRIAERKIRWLEESLERLQKANPVGTKALAKVSVRRMIARLHEELAAFEATARTSSMDVEHAVTTEESE